MKLVQKTEVGRQKAEFKNLSSEIRFPASETGVALIITLILLSITLLMAVAFLLISQREQAASHTQADDATARLAADAALKRAENQIIANIMSGPQANPYAFGLLVSTNYINYGGFVQGSASPTNVNYDYLYNSTTPLNAADDLQNLANLFFDPRLPVFVPTNSNGKEDFRFFLDLNRNGYYEQNMGEIGDPEWIGVLERPDVSYGPNNKGLARFAFIAIPVGNELDLNAIHNQAQRGTSLPVNSVVNPPLNISGPPFNDIFVRNEGVGSWELNFAAFLADLNTNEWGRIIDPSGAAANGFYQYNEPANFNRGVAFDNARELLTYRYNNDFNTLDLMNVFSNSAVAAFESDSIDGFTFGSPQMNTFKLPADNDLALINNRLPWVGADNTNHYFNLPMDLFDTNKTSMGVNLLLGKHFIANLNAADSNTNSDYNRTTFYRMLSQLGTDSAPEDDKMNLNYDNLDAGGAAIPNAETNFISWTPIRFFTNAADRMLRLYTARWAAIYATNELGFVTNGVSTNFVRTFNVTNSFGITAIPVWVSNKFVYTPSVQRVLQMAANFYDSTTNGFYPSVFRPLFMHDNDGNVFIVGYEDFNQSLSTNALTHGNQLTDQRLSIPAEVTDLNANFPANIVIETNVYGVPWIIGAKKAFPNFNEFAIQSAFQVTRKLQVLRGEDTSVSPPTFTPVYQTNQMYLMSIMNSYGIECWNPYRQLYQGADDIIVRLGSVTRLSTNENNTLYAGNGGYFFTTNSVTMVETPYWPAWDGLPKSPSGSFILPLNTTNVMVLTNAQYVYNPPSSPGSAAFATLTTNPPNFIDQGIRQMPHMVMLMTNRLQVIIIDYSTNANSGNSGTSPAAAGDFGRVVDYVQLGGLDNARDLNAEVIAQDTLGLWDTNLDANGIIKGISDQMHVSQTGQTWSGIDMRTNSAYWRKTPYSNPDDEVTFFNAFFTASGLYDIGGTNYYNTLTNEDAPYTPSITVYGHTSWQANDPFVHYLASDLAASGTNDNNSLWPGNLGKSNDRYLPWAKSLSAVGALNDPCNYAFKDPLIYEASDWDFPTNKFPTVGWLGRVHRGTPWQTIYLKSTNILNYAQSSISGITTWIDWTGDQIGFDQTNTAPIEDRLLFDLFTSKFNDNGSRGTLSVNVGAGTPGGHNLAAWSALFSGVTVVANTNNVTTTKFRQITWPRPVLPTTLTTIQPAGPYTIGVSEPTMYMIASNIDTARANFKNRDGVNGVFEHVGDILSTPQLSEQSPFINHTAGIQLTNANDEMYEWLPQQVMSLVRVGSPRYVIYSWGQTLKPAPNSIYSGGGAFFQMVTNYQVMAEAATRTVVRIEGAPTNTHAVVESFNILPPQ